MLEAEDHADDVEHFQDLPDPLDTTPPASVESQQAAEHSAHSMLAEQGQNSREDEEEEAGMSSEEEELQSKAQHLTAQDSEDEEGVVDADMQPSTSGRNQHNGAKNGSQNNVGPGVGLMGGYDMRKRYTHLVLVRVTACWQPCSVGLQRLTVMHADLEGWPLCYVVKYNTPCALRLVSAA